MVDPNRKINRLTNDGNFLEDCEDEFAYRFTEDDPEFMAHCSKPVADPPLVDNWGNGGGGGGRDGSGSGGGGGGFDLATNRYHNQRQGYQRRGGGGGYYNNHNHDRGYPYRDNRRYRSDMDSRRGGRERPYDNHRQRHDGGGGRDRPYEHRSRHDGGSNSGGGGGGGVGGGGGGGGGSGGGGSMRVRRDYGNFVPASKD